MFRCKSVLSPGSDLMLSVVGSKHVGEVMVLITSQGSWALFLAVNRCEHWAPLCSELIWAGTPSVCWRLTNAAGGGQGGSNKNTSQKGGFVYENGWGSWVLALDTAGVQCWGVLSCPSKGARWEIRILHCRLLLPLTLSFIFFLEPRGLQYRVLHTSVA